MTSYSVKGLPVAIFLCDGLCTLCWAQGHNNQVKYIINCSDALLYTAGLITPYILIRCHRYIWELKVITYISLHGKREPSYREVGLFHIIVTSMRKNTITSVPIGYPRLCWEWYLRTMWETKYMSHKLCCFFLRHIN